MTREEAIKTLKEHKIMFQHDFGWDISTIKALDMAIKTLEQEPCEDAVSRQEVINCVASNEFRYKIVEDIKTLPSVTPKEKTGWIPVSERLPEADEYIGDVAKYYLVQNEYGDMLVARYTHSEYWEQIYQLKPIADKIVAWMPLPAPFDSQERSE